MSHLLYLTHFVGNVLIGNKRNLRKIKIIDFGLSTKTRTGSYKRCGTMHYMAPELIKKQVQSTAVDIWSTGDYYV